MADDEPEMKTIKVTVSTNKIGSHCTDMFEIEADASDEEIEEAALQAVWNMASWNWEEVPHG